MKRKMLPSATTATDVDFKEYLARDYLKLSVDEKLQLLEYLEAREEFSRKLHRMIKKAYPNLSDARVGSMVFSCLRYGEFPDSLKKDFSVMNFLVMQKHWEKKLWGACHSCP